MKTNFFLTSLCMVLFSITANSQITKGNWMVGGDANFSSITSENNAGTSKYSFLEIQPNFGYFIVDKFIIGNSLGFKHSDESNFYKIGLFTRYYFLKPEKKYNFFSQIHFDYSIGTLKHTNTTSTTNSTYYGIKIGQVIFVNNIVGFEFSIDYNIANHEFLTDKNLKFGIGLQIHLEKDN